MDFLHGGKLDFLGGGRAGFPRVSVLREPGGSSMAVCDVAPEVTPHHFHCISLVTVESLLATIVPKGSDIDTVLMRRNFHLLYPFSRTPKRIRPLLPFIDFPAKS